MLNAQKLMVSELTTPHSSAMKFDVHHCCTSRCYGVNIKVGGRGLKRKGTSRAA